MSRNSPHLCTTKKVHPLLPRESVPTKLTVPTELAWLRKIPCSTRIQEKKFVAN